MCICVCMCVCVCIHCFYLLRMTIKPMHQHNLQGAILIGDYIIVMIIHINQAFDCRLALFNQCHFESCRRYKS